MCRIKRKSIDSNSVVWPAVMKSLTFYSSIKKRAFVFLISIKVTVKGERYIKENNLNNVGDDQFFANFEFLYQRNYIPTARHDVLSLN